MSYKIVQPTLNPDKVSRFTVSPGTSDYVITFPNESGEVATTSDIPQGGSTTTYVLQNTYSDSTTNDPQVITEWDIPVVAGKVYKLEYFLYGRGEDGNSFNSDFRVYYQTSSFVDPLSFGFNGAYGSYASPGTTNNLSTPSTGMLMDSDVVAFENASGIFISTETGTLRHLVQSTAPFVGPQSSSYVAGESFLQVTPLN